MPQSHQITEDSPLLHDANCIYCHVDLKLGEHVTVCDDCHSPHHVDCWHENINHCAAFGCNGYGLVGIHKTVAEVVSLPQLLPSNVVVIDKYSRWWGGKPSFLNWLPDGKSIAYSRSDRCVRIVDVANRQIVRKLNCGADATSATWSPDGKQLVVTYRASKRVHVLDTETGQLVAVCRGRYSIRDAKWSPDGYRIATSSSGGDILIWDTMRFNEIARFPAHKSAVCSLCWSPDGQQIASVGTNRAVRLWDAGSGELLREMHDTSRLLSDVIWSPDGSRLLLMERGTARIWHIGTEYRQLFLNGRVYHPSCFDWSPDGRYIVTGAYDGALRIWDCLEPVAASVLYAGASKVLCVDWSSDGSQIAFGASDCTVRTIGLDHSKKR